MKQLFHILLFGAMLFSPSTSPSQDAADLHGRILSSLTDDSDTIDFGFLLVGDSLFRPLYFINDGTDTLKVDASYIAIRNYPDTSKRTEFLIEAFAPLIIDTNYRETNPFKFMRAFAQRPIDRTQQPPAFLFGTRAFD